ncbi:MAG TPA: phosphatase PAP2 family protein, partial [Candidatus Limnocylindrales bacterium]|nr:phosphatase PAP2 family protein [Candidatus Limnocylindrales bacterium]
NDFPSGHSTIGAAVAVGLLLVAPDRLRWLVLPAGALAAGFIGHATQVAGWHRLSGSLGGVLLVLAVASGALLALAQAGLVHPSGHGRVSDRVKGLLVAIGSLLVLLGAVVLAIFVGFPLLSAPEGASSAFLHTAFDALGAGVTVLALVAFAAAIEPYAFGLGDEPPRPGVPEPTARPERAA